MLFLFFFYHYNDRTTETTKCSKKNLNRNIGAENALLDSKRREELEKKGNIVKVVKILSLLKKETKPIKDIRNLVRLQKENKAIKDRIIRDIRGLFEQEKEDYCKLVSVGNFWSRIYIEFESNGDRNKTLSIEEYLNNIRPYLKDIINDLTKVDTWKI